MRPEYINKFGYHQESIILKNIKIVQKNMRMNTWSFCSNRIICAKIYDSMLNNRKFQDLSTMIVKINTTSSYDIVNKQYRKDIKFNFEIISLKLFIVIDRFFSFCFLILSSYKIPTTETNVILREMLSPSAVDSTYRIVCK